MASILPGSTVTLHGGPDSLISTPDARSSRIPMMQLDLTDDMLEELLRCTKSGEASHIIFGSTPVLRYNGKSHVLDASTERFRNEVYRHGPASTDKNNSWDYTGLVSHSLAVQAVDTALETLKKNLATASLEKEAQGSGSVDGILTPLTRKGLTKKALKHSSLLRKPLPNGSSRSQPASPSYSASSSARGLAPTSAPLRTDDASALEARTRNILHHLLAIAPASDKELRQKTRLPADLLTKVVKGIAKYSPETSQWKLNDKSYKEVDLWNFRYPSQDIRQKAIDNAVRAYDRLRVSRDDKLWQLLLPEEERGKGKVLSRLNLHQGPIETSRTPVMKPIDKKTGLPKKAAAAKKASKDDEVKAQEKKVEEDGIMIKSKPREAGKPEAEKKKASSKKEVSLGGSSKASRAAEGKSPQAKSSKTTHGNKPSKQSNGSNQQTVRSTKPKNPSPLSASPPVNASDFEDDHPVHKALSAAPSPAKTTNSDKPAKRKLQDSETDHKNEAMPKRRKPEPEARSKPTFSDSAPGKRKMHDTIDVHRAPTSPPKKVKTEDVHNPFHRRNLSSSSSLRPDNEPPLVRDFDHTTPPTSASPTPPPGPLRLSWRQTVNLAQQFKSYYPAYVKLYEELASSPIAPTAEKRAELMKMHDKLAQMKRDIAEGALGRKGARSLDIL